MASLRCANSQSSAARAFLQLCTRPAAPVLDILLPLQARAAAHLVPARAFSSLPPSASRANPSLPAHHRRVLAPHAAPARHFSSSAARRKTVAAHNPQSDEDGNPMILEMTPRAAHRLSQIMTKDANPDLALRVRVEAGGCHGFQYLMSLTTLASPPPPPPQPSSDATGRIPPDAAEVARDVTPSTTTSNAPSPAGLGEDDTVFAFVKDGEVDDDAQTLASRPKMVLDGPSLELLKGSKVDFTMELIGSQFKIVDNPLATSSCGCGTSFDVKL